MSRVLIPVLLSLVLLSAGPTAAMAAPPGTASQLRALEHVWMRASRTRDTATLNRLLADDFVHISYSGRVLSKRDALRAPVAPRDVHQRLSELRVRVFGRTGIVTGLNTVTGPDNAVEIRLRFTDVFVRRHDRWQVVSAQETPERPGRPGGH